MSEIEPLGPHQLAIGELAGARFVAQLPPHHPLAIGAPCPILADPDAAPPVRSGERAGLVAAMLGAQRDGSDR